MQLTPNEKKISIAFIIVVSYLVLGDYLLPYQLRPTTVLTQSESSKVSTADFSGNRTDEITAFCIELITQRYNKVEIYTMLSSGMKTNLIDMHKAWVRAGGVRRTPACVVNARSRLEDGLYQLLANVGGILGSMGRSEALDFALQRCVSSAKKSC